MKVFKTSPNSCWRRRYLVSPKLFFSSEIARVVSLLFCSAVCQSWCRKEKRKFDVSRDLNAYCSRAKIVWHHFSNFNETFFDRMKNALMQKKIINNLTFLYLSLLSSFSACWEDWFNHSKRRARKTETPVTLILKFLADRFLFLSPFSSESKRQFSHDLLKCLAAKFLPGFLLARSSLSLAEIVNFWFYDFIWYSHSILTTNREKKKDVF